MTQEFAKGAFEPDSAAEGSGGSAHQPDACTLRSTYKNGSECGAPALYRVFGTGCYVCERYAADGECIGHPVCVEHAADLRLKSVPQIHPSRPKQPPPFTVSRMHSLRQVRVHG